MELPETVDIAADIAGSNSAAVAGTPDRRHYSAADNLGLAGPVDIVAAVVVVVVVVVVAAELEMVARAVAAALQGPLVHVSGSESHNTCRTSNRATSADVHFGKPAFSGSRHS